MTGLLVLAYSGQVDTQLQITGSILQPSISGNIKLSQGEAYLPHDKGSGTAPFNRLPSNQTRLPKDTFNRMVAARYVSRFFGAEPVISTSSFLQPLGNYYHVHLIRVLIKFMSKPRPKRLDFFLFLA